MRKDTNSLVSVIVPIYKVETDLPNCVQSICNQSSHCCSKLCTPLRGEQQATQYVGYCG